MIWQEGRVDFPLKAGLVLHVRISNHVRLSSVNHIRSLTTTQIQPRHITKSSRIDNRSQPLFFCINSARFFAALSRLPRQMLFCLFPGIALLLKRNQVSLLFNLASASRQIRPETKRFCFDIKVKPMSIG
jgi:hypothetical protein